MFKKWSEETFDKKFSDKKFGQGQKEIFKISPQFTLSCFKVCFDPFWVDSNVKKFFAKKSAKSNRCSKHHLKDIRSWVFYENMKKCDFLTLNACGEFISTEVLITKYIVGKSIKFWVGQCQFMFLSRPGTLFKIGLYKM